MLRRGNPLIGLTCSLAGALLVSAIPTSTLASGYQFRDLSTMANGTYTKAYAVNSSGVVAGAGDTINHTNQRVEHAFSWADNVFTDLGTLYFQPGPFPPEVSSSQAYAINSSGQVGGHAISTPGGSYGQAFIWTNGTMQNLGTFGGPGSGTRGLNDSGNAVGWAQGVTFNGAWYPYIQRAFFYDAATGTKQDIGVLGSDGVNPPGAALRRYEQHRLCDQCRRHRGGSK